MVTRKESER